MDNMKVDCIDMDWSYPSQQLRSSECILHRLARIRAVSVQILHPHQQGI